MCLKPRALAAVALAAAITIVLGGCNSGPATDGPLGGGAFGSISGGDDCVPGHPGRPQTFGDVRYTNQGHATVVLDRVILVHPINERLIGSYAVPGMRLIGVPGNWPPKYPGIAAEWKDRQPVHGFRLAPGKSFNMVLGVVAASAGAARSRGMVVYYHDSAGSYLLTNHLAMTIAVNKPQGCN